LAQAILDVSLLLCHKRLSHYSDMPMCTMTKLLFAGLMGRVLGNDLGNLDELLTADECVGDSCDLSLRQLRGNKTAQAKTQAEWGSCMSAGCPRDYKPGMHCQCNSRCHDYGNCCRDVASCSADSKPQPTAPTAPTTVTAKSHGIAGHPDPSKTYPSYPGFTLAVVEEFNAPIDLDTDPIWTWSDGGLYEGDVRFVKQQISFSGGKMKITAKPNPGIPTQSCSRAEVFKVDNKPLVSGEFRSRRNMFRYGRYEVRMKAPEVQPGNPDINGNFVATMFVFRDAKFRHWREIDIEVTGDSPTSVTTNVLRADNTEWWSPRIAASRESTLKEGNARAEFHTYGFEWLPNKVTWFIDGKVVREHHGGQPPIPDKSAKVMMNLWIFGPPANFGGKQIHNNRYPMTSEYDWFRFYKWDGETTYPCPGSTSCLTDDDKYMDGNNPCDGQPNYGSWKGKQPCAASCR